MLILKIIIPVIYIIVGIIVSYKDCKKLKTEDEYPSMYDFIGGIFLWPFILLTNKDF